MSLWGFVPWWQIYFLDSLLLGIPAQNSANQKAYISYTYGADGNRVKKFVNTKPAFAGGVIDKNTITDPTAVTITWYLRDASGNIMAVYEQNHAESGTGYKAILRQAEVPLYGSDRLGMYKPALTRSLFEPEFAANAEIPIFELSSLTNTASATTFYATRLVGQKYYELKDHLGNIRAVVTDQLTAAADVEVTSASNYYPFGMLQPGNSAQSKDYRFGFNGKEMDNDLGHGTGNMYDYGFRIYNPRIGKFLSVDPLTKSYPGWSPYPFAMNRVIDGIDLDGLEFKKAGKPEDPENCVSARDNNQYTTIDDDHYEQTGRDKKAEQELETLKFIIGPRPLPTIGLTNFVGNYISTMQDISPVSFGSPQGGMGNGLARDRVIQAAAFGGLATVAAPVFKVESSGGIIVMKGISSAGIQYAMKKEIDMNDVVGDAFFKVPLGNALFNVNDITYSSNEFNFKSILDKGFNSSTGFEFSNTLIWGKFGDLSMKPLSPLLRESAEKFIFETVTTLPSTVGEEGIQRTVDEKRE